MAGFTDPVRYEDGQWGFYDETWTEFNMGFKTESEARAAQEKYAMYLSQPRWRPGHEPNVDLALDDLAVDRSH